jgi:serine/threonine protein kinase
MPPRSENELPTQVVGKYRLGKVLGAGDFDCRIRLCTHVVTGIEYAVKIYDKNVLSEHQWMWEQIRDSIQVMRTLPKHDHLVEMVECFETEQSLYILMHFVTGRSLLRYYLGSQKGESVPMQSTKAIFAQIVFGLAHMHAYGVVHSGLAPDHIIINDVNLAKISFLVAAKSVPKGKQLNAMRGTRTTVAPEILEQVPYDPYAADMWSLGVVLFFMLNGARYPFDGANTTKNIRLRKIRPLNPNLPEDAKDLVNKLLVANPKKRMTMEQLLDHPFFITACQLAVEVVPNLNPLMCPRPIPPKDQYIHRSYVSASLSDGGVSIRLPKGLSAEEEAAYIIQHTWRLTKMLRQMKGKNSFPQDMEASTTESHYAERRLMHQIAPQPAFKRKASPTRESLYSTVSELEGLHRASSTASDAAGEPDFSLGKPALSWVADPGMLSSEFSGEVAALHDNGNETKFANIYQCPTCGRLPPSRLTGTKAPYPNVKLKYSNGKFVEATTATPTAKGSTASQAQTPTLPALGANRRTPPPAPILTQRSALSPRQPPADSR